MTDKELRERLAEQLQRVAEWNYHDALSLSAPLKSEHGELGTDSYYQVDIRILQQGQSVDGKWIEVTVAVDDGQSRGGFIRRSLGVLTPETGSVVFYANGRIETLARKVK